MAFTPSAGKYGRVNQTGVPVAGITGWTAQFRRERIDVTNFESSVSADGYNVFSDGLTGVLDSTFNIEAVTNVAAPAAFFPIAPLFYDFLYTKAVPIGFTNIYCDILNFSPGPKVRAGNTFTAELQSSGAVY